MNIKKEVFKGFLSGLLSSIIGIYICIIAVSNIKGDSVAETYLLFKAENKLWMFIALGSLLNLAIFFRFLNKDLEYKARGVVLATILLAFLAYGLYFL